MNTLVLYFRSFFMTVAGKYTQRVVMLASET